MTLLVVRTEIIVVLLKLELQLELGLAFATLHNLSSHGDLNAMDVA